MKYSSSVLWLLIFFVLIAVCVFASLIYYAERIATRKPDENMFGSIPDAIWFNMITMSTIGYGDLYPKTMLGMLIGAVSTGTSFGLPGRDSQGCFFRSGRRADYRSAHADHRGDVCELLHASSRPIETAEDAPENRSSGIEGEKAAAHRRARERTESQTARSSDTHANVDLRWQSGTEPPCHIVPGIDGALDRFDIDV